jgi:hypothetical protein
LYIRNGFCGFFGGLDGFSGGRDQQGEGEEGEKKKKKTRPEHKGQPPETKIPQTRSIHFSTRGLKPTKNNNKAKKQQHISFKKASAESQTHISNKQKAKKKQPQPDSGPAPKIGELET